MSDFEHVAHNDPRHTDWHSVSTLHNFTCLSCGATASQFSPYAPYCTMCNAYSFRETTKVADTKVAEIKSRTSPVNDASVRSKGRSGRFDDGLVTEMKAVIKPRVGTLVMKLIANMDKQSFMKGQVMVEWADKTFLTSVYEFNRVFKDFDPTGSLIVKADDGTDLTISPKVVKGRRKLGPLDVLGGKSKRYFEEGLIEVSCGTNQATYSMFDLAQVLIHAV